ncbi:MAG: Heavy-metal-associated domain protein [bacterium ADurb.BinA186]|nr:MAG: Heavy-metal-associated domain protein [bacterium ADurb.BinA186]
MKSPLYIAILLVIGSQALIFNACAPYEEDPSESISASDSRLRLTVDNIPCQPCIVKIEGALKKLDGIKYAKATIAPQDNLYVIFDPKRVTLEQIKTAIESTGKKVR